jgi:hypothetical protein
MAFREPACAERIAVDGVPLVADPMAGMDFNPKNGWPGQSFVLAFLRR